MPKEGIVIKMNKRSILKTLASSLLILTLICLITVSTDVKAECKSCRKVDYVVYREPALTLDVAYPCYYYYFDYPYYLFYEYPDYYLYDYYYYSYYNPYYVVLDEYLDWFEVYYPVYYKINYDSIVDFYYSNVCCYEAFDWRYYWNNTLLYWTPCTTVIAPVANTVKPTTKVEEPKKVYVSEAKSNLAAVNGNITVNAAIPQSLNAKAEIILYTNTNNEITGTILFRDTKTGEYLSFQDPVTVIAAGFGAGQAQIKVDNGLYQVVSYQQNQGGNLQFVINPGATFRVVK